MKSMNLLHQRFGRLVVIKRVENSPHGETKWLCKCDCGNEVIVFGSNLKKRHTLSCGCLRKEKTIERHKIHGLTSSKLYRIYHSMLDRCYKKAQKSYSIYSGRGITVCDEWKKDFQTFYDWAINNGYKEGLTIDRIDVNANYEPNNCRWSTKTEQANNRRTSSMIEYNGEHHTIAEWAKIYNMPYTRFYKRVMRGWSMEMIINTPRLKYNSKYYNYLST